MTVTLITTKSPALSSGSEVRNYYLLKMLLSDSTISRVELVYIFFSGSRTDCEVKDKKLNVHYFELKSRSVPQNIIAYLKGKIPYVEHLKCNPYLKDIVRIANESELIFLSELDGYFVAERALKNISSKTRVVLDCHNIDAKRLSSEMYSASFMKRILMLPLIKELEKQEIRSIKKVDLVLCCSIDEKKYFKKFIDESKIEVIPNGVTMKTPTPKLIRTRPDLLFMGLLSYAPNEDALRFYFDEVHPLIKRKVKDFTVSIIGKNPPKWLLDLAAIDDKLNVLGFVRNVDKYIQQSSVCLCPLRFGAGTKLKVLEYMSVGKPVISTGIGVEGLPVSDGKDVLIANTAEEFADAVIEVLQSEKLQTFLGNNAQTLIEKEFQWQTIGQKLLRRIKVLS